MNGEVLQQTYSDAISYGLARSPGKSRRLPESYCVEDIRQKQSGAFGNVGCYYVEADIPKNFKALFVICHMVDDKWAFLKNIGRLLELEREVNLQSEAASGLRLWRNLQLHYSHASMRDAPCVIYGKRQTRPCQKEAEILPPERKTKVDLEGIESFFEIDDQTMMAAALEQLDILNKEVTALKDRVDSSLERMDEMEKKNE